MIKLRFTHVNMMIACKEPQLPFGGIKESGIGMPEGGKPSSKHLLLDINF